MNKMPLNGTQFGGLFLSVMPPLCDQTGIQLVCFFNILATSCAMQDLSSLTRNQTHALPTPTTSYFYTQILVSACCQATGPFTMMHICFCGCVHVRLHLWVPECWACVSTRGCLYLCMLV